MNEEELGFTILKFRVGSLPCPLFFLHSSLECSSQFSIAGCEGVWSSEELLASWPLRNLWFAVQAVKLIDIIRKPYTLIIYMCPYGGNLIYVSYLRATQTMLSSEVSKFQRECMQVHPTSSIIAG